MKQYFEYIMKALTFALLCVGIICIEHFDQLVRLLILNYSP